ncbi:hypothetical protein K432DRAFT_409214, partial [Lepidopterella palustris CBS 459.81]
LLYDLDCEADRITVIQSLLLLSHIRIAPSPETSQKDTWHWLGVAVSLCFGTRLNRYPSASILICPEKRRSWKRTWWACFVLDQMASLRLRRLPRIRRTDFHLPMVAVEDFELDRFDGEAGRGEGWAVCQRNMAAGFVEKAWLCLNIGWSSFVMEEKGGDRGKARGEDPESESWNIMFRDLVHIPDGELDWERGLEWVGIP